MVAHSLSILRRYRAPLFWGLLFVVFGCSVGTGVSQLQKLKDSPSHHTEEGFKNPYPIDEIKRSFWLYWRMRLFDEDFPDYSEVAHQVPVVELKPGDLEQPTPQPRLTWIGHATFLFQYQGIILLTDPHMSRRASPLSFTGPKRLVPLPIDATELPPIDYVVISHSHYDHLDETTVKALGDRPMWLVPLGVKAIIVDWGIDPNRVVELDWWQSQQFDAVRFTTTPAHHFSARSLFDRNQTLWASWMVEMDGFSLWFSGDTAYNSIHFKQIGERFPDIDLALIPIGAYGPRWFMKASHVNPEEAVMIHQEIGATQSIGMHWGTFQLTSEPMLEPPKRLVAAVKAAGKDIDFDVMAIGQVREIPARRE